MTAKQVLATVGWLIFSVTAVTAAPAAVTADLNLRSGPGTNYAVMGSFRAGTVVEVETCAGRWCAVAYGDVRGYVTSAYLAPVSNVGLSLPTAGLIPLGTHLLGGLIGIEFGTIGSERSYEGGYNPPRRRLFPPDEEASRVSGSLPLLGGLLPSANVPPAPPPAGGHYAPRRTPSVAQRESKLARPVVPCPDACRPASGNEAPPPVSSGY